MVIRRANAADLEGIARIQSASRAAAQWPVADYLTYDCAVAVDGEEVAGFLVSRETAGEREILNVAVDPARRRQGVARALVEYELSRPASAWFLEVRESNHSAIQLYERAGFREAGRRPRYYEDPPEGAIVMRFLSC